jgi:hypothetical protein
MIIGMCSHILCIREEQWIAGNAHWNIIGLPSLVHLIEERENVCVMFKSVCLAEVEKLVTLIKEDVTESRVAKCTPV